MRGIPRKGGFLVGPVPWTLKWESEVRWIGSEEGDLNTTHLGYGHVIVAAFAVIVHVSFPTEEDLLVATTVVDVPEFLEEDPGREMGDERHESWSFLIWGVTEHHES